MFVRLHAFSFMKLWEQPLDSPWSVNYTIHYTAPYVFNKVVAISYYPHEYAHHMLKNVLTVTRILEQISCEVACLTVHKYSNLSKPILYTTVTHGFVTESTPSNGSFLWCQPCYVGSVWSALFCWPRSFQPCSFGPVPSALFCQNCPVSPVLSAPFFQTFFVSPVLLASFCHPFYVSPVL